MALKLNTHEGSGHIIHIQQSPRALDSFPSTQPGKFLLHESTSKPGGSWFLLPTPVWTNLLFYAQNAVKCDRRLKHRQHVNLIHDHMQLVPVVGRGKKNTCSFYQQFNKLLHFSVCELKPMLVLSILSMGGRQRMACWNHVAQFISLGGRHLYSLSHLASCLCNLHPFSFLLLDIDHLCLLSQELTLYLSKGHYNVHKKETFL